LALRKQIEQNQKELSFVDYKVAYNTNEAALLQMLEVFLQKRNETKLNFWKWIGHSFAIENKDSFKLIVENYYKEEKFKDVDLRIQVKNYKDWISKKVQIITVAHSQGNFYTNLAFNQLDRAQLQMISVATPASEVFADGPYYTFHSDRVISYIPRALSTNRTKEVEGLVDHEFINHYLGDKTVRDEILGSIFDAYNYSSRPNEPSMNPKDGYFDQDVDLVLNWLNNSLESHLDGIEKSDCLIAYALFSVYTHHGRTCKQRNFSSILNSVSDCKADLMDIDNKRDSTSCYFHYGMDALNFRESYYPPEQDLFLKMYPQCHISSHSKFEKTVSPADLDVALAKLRTYQIK